MENASTNELILNGLLIIIVVFVALVLLWLVMVVLSKIMQKVDKKDAVKCDGPPAAKLKSPKLTRLYVVLAVFCIALALLLIFYFASVAG